METLLLQIVVMREGLTLLPLVKLCLAGEWQDKDQLDKAKTWFFNISYFLAIATMVVKMLI